MFQMALTHWFNGWISTDWYLEIILKHWDIQHLVLSLCVFSSFFFLFSLHVSVPALIKNDAHCMPYDHILHWYAVLEEQAVSASLVIRLLCCFFLRCQVRFKSLVQSVSPVLLAVSQMTGTLNTTAIAALETAGQVKKLWVISTNLTVSPFPVRSEMMPVICLCLWLRPNLERNNHDNFSYLEMNLCC